MSPILLAAACASIVSDDDTTTYIATEPENARCELQGDSFNRVVNTPASISLPADAAPITVVCEAEGFRQTSLDMDTSADGWIMGNIIFGGLIGVAIDAARGAGQKYPAELTVILEPGSFESLAARDAWYDARGQEINDQWNQALKTIDNECNRNMKELCAEKKNDAEKLRAEELEALEQRRRTAVVSMPEGKASPQTLDGSKSDTEETTGAEPPSGQSGAAQVAGAAPGGAEGTHPFDGTWTGTAVIVNPSCRVGAASQFNLTLTVENGQIHGGDPGGRYAADGEVGADGRLERASLNKYLFMDGSILDGVLRHHTRDCGARYTLTKVATP